MIYIVRFKSLAGYSATGSVGSGTVSTVVCLAVY